MADKQIEFIQFENNDRVSPHRIEFIPATVDAAIVPVKGTLDLQTLTPGWGFCLSAKNNYDYTAVLRNLTWAETLAENWPAGSNTVVLYDPNPSTQTLTVGGSGNNPITDISPLTAPVTLNGLAATQTNINYDTPLPGPLTTGGLQYAYRFPFQGFALQLSEYIKYKIEQVNAIDPSQTVISIDYNFPSDWSGWSYTNRYAAHDYVSSGFAGVYVNYVPRRYGAVSTTPNINVTVKVSFDNFLTTAATYNMNIYQRTFISAAPLRLNGAWLNATAPYYGSVTVPNILAGFTGHLWVEGGYNAKGFADPEAATYMGDYSTYDYNPNVGNDWAKPVINGTTSAYVYCGTTDLNVMIVDGDLKIYPAPGAVGELLFTIILQSQTPFSIAPKTIDITDPIHGTQSVPLLIKDESQPTSGFYVVTISGYIIADNAAH
ncbi:MAG: hypothetical protein [Bacteriophage sp.]|nr:MAG: hypothetical protein [Bacteriophage sp.]